MSSVDHSNTDPKYLVTYVGLAFILVIVIVAQSCNLNKLSQYTRRGAVNASDNNENTQTHTSDLATLKSLRYRYLIVYGLMVAGDWLQGPYLYALYSSYGLSKDAVSHLFVVGFGSSMVFGCLAGSMADRFGRKPLAITYAILYILSCSAFHFHNFPILILGRFLGGISTSLLFSVFESWLVNEAHREGMGADAIGAILGSAATLNSIVAVACGQVADIAVSLFRVEAGPRITVGGLTAPFDAASVVLAIGAVVLCLTWTESNTKEKKSITSTIDNEGETSEILLGSDSEHIQPVVCQVEHESSSLFTIEESLHSNTSEESELVHKWQIFKSDALMLVCTDRRVQLCGMVQSLFEGVMYTFVLLWTPVILAHTPADQTPPYGVIFGSFMACSALGSQLFNRAMSSGVHPEHMLLCASIVGAGALGTVPLAEWLDVDLTFVGFLLFELCVGVYFPSIGVIKSGIVPEKSRATVYNIFRVPLNMIVLVVLLGDFTLVHTFMLCCVLLVVATMWCGFLVVTIHNSRGIATSDENTDIQERQDRN